jgi:hypothetical protein
MLNKIVKFVKESVEWLIEEQQGCCHYKLDDHLAVCVGWSSGYGEETRDDVIQAKDDPNWAIDAGVKVWTSDYTLTDFDFINFPYYENGDVCDMSVSITPKEDYESVADTLLKWYNDVKDFTLDDDGKILRENMWVCDHCLAAIESREGNQAVLRHSVDEDDDVESKCDWCEDVGFDTLYELI